MQSNELLKQCCDLNWTKHEKLSINDLLNDNKFAKINKINNPYLYFVVTDKNDIRFKQPLFALNGKKKLIQLNKKIEDFYNNARQFEWNYYCKDSEVLYIGKSSKPNKKRIVDYIKTGRRILKEQNRFDINLSSNINHMGGKAIWQIDDINDYNRIYIIVVEFQQNSDVRKIEKELLTCFEQIHGCLPVANHRK